MKEILLYTARDGEIHSHLKNNNINIKKYGLAQQGSNLSSTPGKNSLVIFELNSNNLACGKSLFKSIDKKTGKIIFISEKLDDSIKKFLKDCGSGFFMLTEEMEHMPNFKVNNIFFQKPEYNILLLDDHKKRISILQQISSLFGFRITTVSSEEEYFENSSGDFTFTCINLGVRAFDINRFVKKVQSSLKVSSTPLLVFKDPYEDVKADEIYSGLNRYTKAILSESELYNFLISIFFKQKFFKEVEIFNQATAFNDNQQFLRLSFKEMYHHLGANIFHLQDPDINHRIDKIKESMDMVSANIFKFIILKWLLIAQDENVVTCGQGV